MNVQKAALSFLKQNKIKYFIIGEEIRFQCFLCGKEISMSKLTSEWLCSLCSKEGNLFDLISEFNNRNVIAKSNPSLFLNPLQEKNEIKKLVRLACCQNNQENLASRILLKLDNLYDYFVQSQPK